MRTDEPLSIGERIYVFGVLSAKPFLLDDGRLRQKFIIKSKYIRLRGHERGVQVKDENNVQIQAKITSDIRHTDRYSLFTLASMHKTKCVMIFMCFICSLIRSPTCFRSLFPCFLSISFTGVKVEYLE